MQIEVRWVVSLSASCFYAARAVALGRAPAGSDLAALIAEPAEALCREIDYCGLPAERFWRHLVPLSARIESNRQLAEVALTKTLGMNDRARSAVEPLARCIAEVEAAVLRGRPGLLDEVAEWSEPLRREWNLRGPAILNRAAELTDERLIVPGADAVLVCPVFGGGGTANLEYNSVCIEAVSGSPVPELPEVVRLAWLIAELNVDVPIFGEDIHHDRLPLVAAVAMLPPVLFAAEELELGRCDRATLNAALESGHVHLPKTADPADLVLGWWKTYFNGRPSWNVALAALDRMLG